MGENGAGKSTLLKCLFGIYQKIPAALYFRKRSGLPFGEKKRWRMGFRWYTEVKHRLVQRSVMDNMWLQDVYPTKGMFVDEDKMYEDTKAIFDELDIDITTHARA
ncbi:ATP-binding cassette domain-containing protein [Salmonella enterica subsp. enterica]|nr:ATP-binding cassette domain-containing protein [Salmonella enterica subsp. enterica]